MRISSGKRAKPLILFRLLDARTRGPQWLLLENVSFLLHLDRGRGMRFLVDELEKRSFTWAYRVVDSQAFGLPQRRQRVILLASRTDDPRDVLFADDADPIRTAFSRDLWCGVAVFVDGCFWHCCPTHISWPKANAEWWRAKIEANVRRDRDTDALLRARDWTVIRFWEHEVSSIAADRVGRIVKRAQRHRHPSKEPRA